MVPEKTKPKNKSRMPLPLGRGILDLFGKEIY